MHYSHLSRNLWKVKLSRSFQWSVRRELKLRRDGEPLDLVGRERRVLQSIGRLFRTTWRLGKTSFKIARFCLIAGGLLFVGNNFYRAYLFRQKLLTIDKDSTLYWQPQREGICEVSPQKEILPKGGLDLLRPKAFQSETMTLLDAIRAIRWAAVDPRIKGLVVDFSSGDMGSRGFGVAQLQEIGEAIEFFKESKSKTHGNNFDLVAYGDDLSNQGMYFLASKFNSVFAEPNNVFLLTGFNQTKLSVKRMLEKLGVHVHAETREAHKSVASMFTHEKLPEPQFCNLHELLSDLTDQLASGISAARSIPKQKVLDLFDQGMISMDDPAAKLLFEGTQHRRSVYQRLLIRQLPSKPIDDSGVVIQQMLERIAATEKEFAEKVLPSLGPNARAEFWLSMPPRNPPPEEKNVSITLKRYKAARRYEMDQFMDSQELLEIPRIVRPFVKRRSQNTSGAAPSTFSQFNFKTVGLVHIDGQITRSSGSYDVGSIARAVVEAGKDLDVSAVVLRIDSGGGDATASETICEAVDYVRRELRKPVVVSFGNLAASGAYYAAAPANRIFAMPGTITGSIGVAALRPTLTSKLLEAVGVTYSEVSTTDSGLALGSLFREYDGKYLDLYRRHIDRAYDLFLSRVASGRNMAVEQVRAIAGGRIYTGRQALELKLVDELGGLNDALVEAGRLAMEYAEGQLPQQIQDRQREIREKFHLQVPLPTVQVKHFPRRRGFMEIAESLMRDDYVSTESGYAFEAFLAGALRLASTVIHHTVQSFMRDELSAAVETTAKGLTISKVESILQQHTTDPSSMSCSYDSQIDTDIYKF